MNNRDIVHEHIESILPKLVHPPSGKLPHPALGVGYGQHYAGFIYCWDNHHMSLRFAAGGHPEQMKYFLGNMLAAQAPSGFIPSVINIASGGVGPIGPWHAQPWLAQNAAIYCDLTNDVAWVREAYGKLVAYLNYWTGKHAAPHGLYRWREGWYGGSDNDITSIFPPDSLIPTDLNSLLVLEFQSMAFLADRLQETADGEEWRRRAKELLDAVNQWLWDESFGTYAAYDLHCKQCRVRFGSSLDNDAGTLSDDVGRFAFLSSSYLYPLYAGIAPPERASRFIETYLLSSEHFRSPFGIRSLSKASEYYNQARWGNPGRFGDHRRLTNSNWQGPVWIPLNWFAFHALLRYGCHDAAASLSDDTQNVLAMCIERFGYMRENFDAETGAGLYADHFASWNILADIMPDLLPGGGTSLRLFPWEERNINTTPI